jgi:hypothetical protein
MSLPPPWQRRLWGVAFSGSLREPLLIGTGWHEAGSSSTYDGEPTRVLLFTTRAAARAWCKAKEATYADRTGSLAQRRFRPVRVVERTAVIR